MLLVAYGLAASFGTGSIGRRLVDALKVFPQFPGYEPGKSWPYMVARHLSAIAVLTATVGVVAALLSERIAELRARFRRGHAVVCGLGETGLRNAIAFRENGLPTTCIELTARGDAIDEARRRGALVLHRDATQLSSLQIANVTGAAYVVCSCPDDAMNARIASLIVDLASPERSKRAPEIDIQIDNPHLAQLLRAPLASVGGARLHFFNMANVWARALLDRPGGPYAQPIAGIPKILILGTASLGSAVAVEAARRWHRHVRSIGTRQRARIVVVGPRATETCARLTKRYRAIREVCDLEGVDDALEPGDPLDAVETQGPAAVYACLADASANLAVALEAKRTLPDESSVFVPASAAAESLSQMFTGTGHIQLVDLSSETTSLDLLHDQMTNVVAQAAHEGYLAERQTEPDFGTRPGDREWENLPEEVVDANLAHAKGIIEQLRGVWYEIDPLYDWDEPPVPLTSEAVEAMAELEHGRWCREKRAAGWKPGSPRSNNDKIHDLLVPWMELEPKPRDIDRAMVKRRPWVLAAVGYRLSRDPVREQLARQLHESYAETRRAAGEDVPHAVPWSDLPEDLQESNRAAIDHIAVKLARIGCRIVPRGIGSVERFPFSDDEIEQMAILEHDRWLAQKHAAGVTLGPREEVRQTHPSMVPWEALSEAEREKDREIVRAIPDQLTSVGYAVVRDDVDG
jgi:voltage-gated potassium channel Kch